MGVITGLPVGGIGAITGLCAPLGLHRLKTRCRLQSVGQEETMAAWKQGHLYLHTALFPPQNNAELWLW